MIKALVDWFDLRLGVRGFYDRHIAYPLPEGLNIWHLFGGLTIGCVLIQFATGFYMLWYYIPEPDLAHQSIRDMCNQTSLGALFRNAHRYSATLAIVFIFIHFIHILAKRAYRAPRELNWWTGLTLAFIFIMFLITGIIMPWDWRSYWELVIWTDWIGTIPLLGEHIKGPMLHYFSLGRNFSIHIYLLPALFVGLVLIHIILFRRLGLSKKV
ncbi:hypothetical protein MNBD_NITROSPINAE03-495 [hydrothermal vent metagenome]|uniref:Cytochrome b/b6 N-terminal region profile domain-containing protein n=1 Tax=hydrothermal vent metagenome TaxID=652676 RepID=A0A3B1BK83_9ZZZZ